MEIFVSSACLPESDLSENLIRFKSLGYEKVELTGGISFEPDIFQRIDELEDEISVDLQLHNYSPPPEQSFVLNLASLDSDTYEKSTAHVVTALEYTRKKTSKYAVHAGFYIPVLTSELGQRIKKRELYDKQVSMERFVNTLNNLYSGNESCLYVENNVVSAANFNEYGENPFMLTCASEYFELKKQIPQLKLLLDFAHLKVSCKTLGLSFQDELASLIGETDYLHLSDNDGMADTNQGLTEESDIYEVLKTMDLSGYTMTLEVYSGVDDVRRSYDLIEKLK